MNTPRAPRWTIALAVVPIFALAGCQLGGAPTGGDADIIRIGYVTPQTGPLAAFGEADSFVLDQMKT
ncbi:MAG: hypothetical protein ABL886_04580, partial [Rhodoglobus sp.]